MNSSTRIHETHRQADDSERGSAWLEALAAQLAAHRRASIGRLSESQVESLRQLGLRTVDGYAALEGDVELLSAAAVRASLDDQTKAWLRDLEIRPAIGSTNTALLQRGAAASIDGSVLTAEMQTAGRGRRGRTWLSPFGRNLAVSIGFRSVRPLAQLGALSLVVGLAVRQALLAIGLDDVALKWPNDVLLQGRKLAGILIESVRATAQAEVVIGIGINVGGATTVAAQVDRAVADVAEQIEQPSRNALLAGVVNRTVAASQRFDRAGFGPFRQAWQDAHRYQGAAVAVTAPATADSVSGTVLGVTDDGALRLQTASGVREFTSGEVTLRGEEVMLLGENEA